jgi:aryl-alcohol dehydrogenase-like predicted oxidoreductase
MQYRELGRTGWQVSEISFGAWAIGGSWGAVDDATSRDALARAIDRGVNFIDTADVYGDGRSERLVGELVRGRAERIYVATKAGRRSNPHTAESYNRTNLEAYVDRSLENLGTGVIDVLQLHCPPSGVYTRDDVFDALERMVRAGKILHYGISVEKVDEAMTAIQRYPGIQSVQIIFNVLRQKPSETFFAEAARRRVAILARVPLASGLLTGKLNASSTFAPDDHRRFNRHGEAFDVGETFSGVPFEKGLAAADALRGAVPANATLAQFALKWILMHPEVTCAIPGAKTPAQVDENVAAAELAPLGDDAMRIARDVYDRFARADVHAKW